MTNHGTSEKNEKSHPRSATPSRGSLPSLSAVSTQPLNPEIAQVIFTEVIREALRLKIIDVFALLRVITVKRLLESLKEDFERRAQLVHLAIGTALKLALAQSKQEGSIDRQATDVAYMIFELKDDDTANKLIEGYGFKEAVGLVPLWQLYELLMGGGWMLRDSEAERELGFHSCKLLIEHRIYESKTLVLEHIRNSIRNENLVGDSVPAAKRAQILDNIMAAMKSKAINTTLLGEIIFDAVSLEEYAEFLPTLVLAKPFGDYAQLLGVAEAPKPVVPPPLPRNGPEETPTEPERHDSISPEVSVSSSEDDAAVEDVPVDELDEIAPRCDKCQVFMRRDGEQYACQGCGDTVAVDTVAVISGGAE